MIFVVVVIPVVPSVTWRSMKVPPYCFSIASSHAAVWLKRYKERTQEPFTIDSDSVQSLKRPPEEDTCVSRELGRDADGWL